MKAIISWLSGLIDIIESLIEFVVDFIQQTFDLIVMVGEAAASIPSYFGFLPPVVLPVFLAVLAAAVIFKILGRE